MKLIAEKRVLEMSEGNIEDVSTFYEVKKGETVEELLIC